MPREPLLDFDELLAPIKGDEPAGPPSAYIEIRPQLEEMRREVTPELAAETKEDIKNPDWSGLKKRTQEALTDTTKDLRVAGSLVEAMVKIHGFAGAHDSLKLLRMMVEQCWDRINPPVDPEDADVRGGPFHWLDEPMRSMRFPTTLRMTPLVRGHEPERKGYSFYDFRPPTPTDEAKALKAEAERVLDTAPSDQLAATLEEVAGGLEQAAGLARDLQARITGSEAPALTNIRAALDECKTFLEQALQKRPGAETKADKGAGDGAPATAGGLAPGATRAEIYRQLEQAAHALRDVEPHSPIPYLLLRAVELGRMSFPELMQQLVRDSGALTELKREFGIKDAPPPPSE